jgi:F-type H+-transporting ATPase subunit delta
VTDQSDTRLQVLDATLDEVLDDRREDRGLIGRVVGAVTGVPTAEDLAALPQDLFAVVDALESSAALRRAVTDPGASEDRRRQLVHSVLDGKVSKAAAGIVADAAARRWSSGRTMTAAVERQAVRAELAQAERDGALEETEDELFRFARLVESNPALRDALGDRAVPVANRQALVDDLLASRSGRATVALAKRAVTAHDRTLGHTLEGYVTLAATQKNRVVATVRVARPLEGDQRARLQAALAKQVGREVVLEEVIDSDVLGGVRVELGDEVVEGTVAGRLEDVRHLFG